MMSDVQFDGEEVSGRIFCNEIGYHIGPAESGDDSVPLFQEIHGQEATEARRSACD
jgi:hypothetical protein